MVETERVGLLHSARRPGDVYIHSYRDGVDWAFDVVVTSPLGVVQRQGAAVEILYAAKGAAREKYDALSGLVEDKSGKFQPISMEALGGMDEPSLLLIRSMAKMIGNSWSTRWQDIERTILQEISAIIHKGAAYLLMRCMLDSQP